MSDNNICFDLPSIGIPAEVLFNPFLTVSEQKLFGFIRNLSQSSSGCWATNKYLGSYLFLKKRTISAGISRLKEYGYLLIKHEEMPDGSQLRRIFVNPEYTVMYKPLVTFIHDERNNGNMPDEETLKELVSEIAFGTRCNDDSEINTHSKSLLPPMNKFATKDVNKVVSKESKDSSNGGSLQEPLLKSRRTRRVKTKSVNAPNEAEDDPEPSGKEPVKQEKRKKTKVPHETDDNLRVFRFWNEMSNTTKHRPGTKTYKRALKKIYQLRKGKLNVKDPRANGIPEEWYRTPWKLKDIYRAIRNLNEMHYEGYWPKDKDNLPRSLPDAILNHNKTSWLMIAYKFGAQELNDPLSGKDEYTRKLYDRLIKALNRIRSRELPENKLNAVVEVAENIQAYHRRLPRNAPLAHEIYNEFPNSGSLVTSYTKWLTKEKRDLHDLGPNGIDVGSHIWNEFIKSWEDYIGVDFATGS